MKFIASILFSLIAIPALAANCEESYSIVEECYGARGRLQVSNGTPSVRIWKVGTKRILGVVNENLDNLPQVLKKHVAFDVYIFADYLVCPTTIEEPGHMQMVCVQSLKNVRIEDYRENADMPVIENIENETLQGHADGSANRYALC